MLSEGITMLVTNNDRAEAALMALEVFSHHFGPPIADAEDCACAIADLIGNLGHYAEERGLKYPRLVALGVGMWSAETRDPDPPSNDVVEIIIHQR